MFANQVAGEVSAALGALTPPSKASVAAGEIVGEGGESASVDFPLIGSLDSTSFWAAFVNSLIMIIVTELGDKTFFIAAVLAMRQDRWAVYLGAVGALALMTVLSAAMGFALPNLLPKQYTHAASALLFLYFGLRLLKDSTEMESGTVSEELQEVEEELVGKKGDDNGVDEEEGPHKGHNLKSSSSSGALGGSSGGGKQQGPSSTKILTQAFTLTFLAEWGDRSQIATIALASAKNPFGVTAGGILGHALCTGIAVIGGRMLAARISEKTVATIGGLTFLAFAAHSFLFPEAFD